MSIIILEKHPFIQKDHDEEQKGNPQKNKSYVYRVAWTLRHLIRNLGKSEKLTSKWVLIRETVEVVVYSHTFQTFPAMRCTVTLALSSFLC